MEGGDGCEVGLERTRGHRVDGLFFLISLRLALPHLLSYLLFLGLFNSFARGIVWQNG